ncbi:hypothetical protein SLNWT_2147 [Streptomyces albus]|uniref:Uncharacterized protein n=1 Tax=Streptomyces albus (strain ATCC 21838 / DSM 41398 / FERM P-419 / JCM 4703 / NBRC 107858) TaxID=1081613 RepID=A0A0B5EJR2_STRA4|nr:hypothetical protein SLNWT_2147 [Streptomyces albus]AOU76838.1 hypothetical protein SLNHY_2147 [Streptomyces albus]
MGHGASTPLAQLLGPEGHPGPRLGRPPRPHLLAHRGGLGELRGEGVPGARSPTAGPGEGCMSKAGARTPAPERRIAFGA